MALVCVRKRGFRCAGFRSGESARWWGPESEARGAGGSAYRLANVPIGDCGY